MTAAEALKRHRAEILRVAAKYGASDVRVFGSVARGEADERSDIDFVVRLAPGRSLFDLGGLLMDLQDRRLDAFAPERGKPCSGAPHRHGDRAVARWSRAGIERRDR
jgi:predicted nucleotidyltransferase